MGLEIAVVGATGVVGREMLDCLEASPVEIKGITGFASPRSRGREIAFRGGALSVEVVEDLDDAALRARGYDVALFAAGSETSRVQAPRFVAAGARVIDNASLFRMDEDVPLVVPEINGDAIRPEHRVIANPNCSTIISLMALAPLHRAAGLRRVVAATYQAASGAGAAGLAELEGNLRAAVEGGEPATEVFGQDLALNLIPWIGPADEGADCEEERKLRRESRKILGQPDLEVSCTTVRVPVGRTHAIALTAETERPLDVEAATACLEAAPGVELDPERDPRRMRTPRGIAGQDAVVVSRLRPAFDTAPGLALFAMGDQIRKGAALNAVQILEHLARS